MEEEYQQGYDAIFLKSAIDPYRAPVFRSVLEHLSVYKNPPGHLLDIGCGAGEFALLCQKMGWTCSGIELSRPAAEFAARQGIMMFPCDWLGKSGDVVDSVRQFDVITMINAFDHMCDPTGVLQRVYQMLKPGGVVVIRVPNATFHLSIRRVLTFLKAQRQQTFHLYLYSPSTLKNLLNSAGLKTRSIRNSHTGSTPSYAQVESDKRLLRRLIWRAGGLGLWCLAQSLYWITGKQAVWASSFELVATREDG